MTSHPASILTALPLPTPAGVFHAWFGQRGLARLDFPGTTAPRRQPAVAADVEPARLRLWLRQTQAALRDVLAGRPPRALPPMDLSAGSRFQQRVWSALRRIRPGQTRSYGELAHELGCPGGARAVGSACGANPIPVLVPCHRVLPKGGGLGGFSGGLDWKRQLLRGEGVEPGAHD